MRDLVADDLRRLHRKIANADRRIALANLGGKVAEVDSDKRRLRLKIGTTSDGRDILGPWSRWQEAGVGGSKFHGEPAIGEQMMLLSMSGTVGAASIAVPGSYDDDNEAPSKSSDTAVIARGNGRIELGPDGIRLIGPVHVEGEALTHNSRNVGDDHKHTGVTPGAALTGDPA